MYGPNDGVWSDGTYISTGNGYIGQGTELTYKVWTEDFDESFHVVWGDYDYYDTYIFDAEVGYSSGSFALDNNTCDIDLFLDLGCSADIMLYGAVLYSSARSLNYSVPIGYDLYYTLDVPTRAGYVFAGWTVSNSSYGEVFNTYTDAYVFHQKGAGNVTLTANWVIAVECTQGVTSVEYGYKYHQTKLHR